jgi:hypothetical protein
MESKIEEKVFLERVCEEEFSHNIKRDIRESPRVVNNELASFNSSSMTKAMIDDNEQHNTGPIAYDTSHTYHSSQYLNLNNSNDFTLGITETNLSVFYNSLEKIKEEDRVKELTKHIDN